MSQDSVIFNLSATNGFSLQTSVLAQPITAPKSANFDEQSLIGRSSPVVIYRDSSCITMDVALKFTVIDQNLTVQDIHNICKGLRSLTFPVASGVNPPPTCTISIGTLTEFQNWQCVCTNFTPNYGEENLYDNNGNPMSITVRVSFKGMELQPVNSSDWAQNSIKAYRQLSFT